MYAIINIIEEGSDVTVVRLRKSVDAAVKLAVMMVKEQTSYHEDYEKELRKTGVYVGSGFSTHIVPVSKGKV
jgi:hypothetical protein